MRGIRSIRPGMLVVLALISACSDASGPGEQPATVTVSAPVNEIAIGGTVQLAAAVLNASGALMSGQQVQWTSTDQAVASVSPGGLVTGVGGGTVEIRATAGTASGTISLIVRAGPCTPASATGTLAVGQTVNGSLTLSDCILLEVTNADAWSFSVAQPTSARFDLTSSQFEAVLLITDRNMNVIAYGEGEGARPASIVHSFAPGNYLVWVASWGTRNTGAYTLSASPVALCSAATSAGSLAVGQTVTGTLAATSCVLPHGYAGMGWRVSVPAATSVRITLQASGFDPLVVATDLNINPLGFGGPLGPGGTAELLQTFGPGEYMIWATSIDGRVGSFTLSMVEARIEECNLPPRPVAVGQTVNGTISSASCRMADGKFADTWRLTLTSPATLVIDMMSSQIDTYLILTDAEGRILGADDDGGSGTDSRLVHQFAPGTYTLWATTYAPGAVGPYQLSVRPAQGGGTPSVQTESAAPAKRGWPAPAEGRSGLSALLQAAGTPAGHSRAGNT